MSAIVVVTTVGDEEQGHQIAHELLVRRHAACVNMISGVKSIYRWKGKICRDGEYVLIIKSMAEEYDAVAATIRELHSYEVPEILAFRVSQGDPSFLDWIRSSLDKEAELENEVEEEFADVD